MTSNPSSTPAGVPVSSSKNPGFHPGLISSSPAGLPDASFDRYLATRYFDAVQRNRPDYRSSAQKRLMPQLSLKVPVFRRWGKRFFVVVDAPFFAAMPPIRAVEGVENSEITWLVYPLARKPAGVGYHLGEPRIVFTLWDDVLSALREGEAPQQSEVLAELTMRAPSLQRFRT